MPSLITSIYIPAYNEEKFIFRALDSIPVRDDIEVIVVDDGSTDNTLKIAQEFMADSKLNMRIISCSQNQGVSYANNIGLVSCKGEYIYLMDADDYLYTREFERALMQLEGDIVYVQAKENDGTVLTPSDYNHNLCAGWFKFIKKDFIKNTLREVNAYGGDYEMNLEMINKPHTSKSLNLIVYHYNYPREGSVTWQLTHTSSEG